MNDRSIAKLSILMAAVGLVGMLSVNLLMVPIVLTISDIDSSRLGQIVSTEAEIAHITTSDGNVFLTLSDGAEIKAIVWSNVARDTTVYDLKSGDNIVVTGQVTSYRGELEIVVSKIEK